MSKLHSTAFTKLVFLLSLTNNVSCNGNYLIKMLDEDPSQATCPLILLRKYFGTVQSLSGAILCVNVRNTEETLLQRTILKQIHMGDINSLPWSMIVNNVRKKLSGTKIIDEKPQCYFILLENLKDDYLKDLIEYWKVQANWNSLAQFVVYMASLEDTEEEMTILMIEILVIFITRKIFNVNVIGQNKNNTIFYGKTVFPYHPNNNCGNRVIFVETLDMCIFREHKNLNIKLNDNFVKNEVMACGQIHNHTSIGANKLKPKLILRECQRGLFIDKFPNDLGGCSLIGAYRPWEPYIFTKNNLSNKNYNNFISSRSGEVDENESYAANYSSFDVLYKERSDEIYDAHNTLNGIEYEMVKIIAERLHLHIEILFENNNLFHLFQQLIDGEIEMIIGGIDEDPGISQLVSTTIPYHQDDLTWCVARAHRRHSFFNFLASFKLDAWLLFIGFVLIASFIVFVAQEAIYLSSKNPHRFLATCIRILGIIVTQSFRPLKMYTTLRIVFCTCFFMAFIFSNTYQSFLISTLTKPSTFHQISHLDEIFSQQLIIMGSAENVRHLNKNSEVFKYIRENFQICYNIVDCMNRAATSENRIAVVVSRQHSFYNPRIQRELLFCFDRNENLYVYLVTMLVPKQFHLLHQINLVIQNIIESGHMHKWARDLDMTRMIHEQMAIRHESSFKKLTISEYNGTFCFALILYLFALIIFVLESVIFGFVMKHGTQIKLLHYFHNCFGINSEFLP